MRRIPPALTLYFLAPVIGELLSGSAPPVEFFHPFGLLVLPALYGSGALLVREIALRWDKRWPSILTLGVAYGIVEEGLMVKSFFDPQWMDLGLLGSYGRLWGVNWVWSLALCIYHAAISIAIPILLAEMLYPDERDRSWVGKRGFVSLSILLSAVVLFGFLALTAYRPPAVPYLLSAVLIVLLYLSAEHAPLRWGEPTEPPRRGSLWQAMIGFLGVIFFFVFTYGLPEMGLPVVVTLLALAALVYTLCRSIRWASGEGAWDDRGRFALVAGALSFFILVGLLMESDPTRADNPAGMSLVAVTAALFLLFLGVRVHRRTRLNAEN